MIVLLVFAVCIVMFMFMLYVQAYKKERELSLLEEVKRENSWKEARYFHSLRERGIVRYEIIDFKDIAFRFQEFICEHNIEIETINYKGKKWWVASKEQFCALTINFPYNIVGGHQI